MSRMAPRMIHYMPQERAASERVAVCGQSCDSGGWNALVDCVNCPECLLIGASLARNPMRSSLAALVALEDGSSHFALSGPTATGADRLPQALSKLTQPQGDDREEDERRPHVPDEDAVVVVESLSETAA